MRAQVQSLQELLEQERGNTGRLTGGVSPPLSGTPAPNRPTFAVHIRGGRGGSNGGAPGSVLSPSSRTMLSTPPRELGERFSSPPSSAERSPAKPAAAAGAAAGSSTEKSAFDKIKERMSSMRGKSKTLTAIEANGLAVPPSPS